MKTLKLLTLASLSILSLGCVSSASKNNTSSQAVKTTHALDAIQPLKLATWNIEHLAYPSNTGCKPRTAQEINQLKAYAAKLDADIVAVQEVASIEALQLLFPSDEWQFVISDRPDSPAYECRGSGFTSTQQKVGFVVKKSIPLLAINNLKALGLDSTGLRYGLSITIDSPLGPTDILNVHMKSGCFVDDYLKSDSDACQTYAKQAPILDDWIAQREISKRPYAVLGDFNHRISAPYNRLTRMLIDESRTTHIATQSIIGCHPRYPAPIDHIVVGGMHGQNVADSIEVFNYPDMNEDAMLSDHCAISASLFTQPKGLSNAVKWQTSSKEYQALTSGVYQQAVVALDSTPAPHSNWVVVMDVDETVLDNSPYQENIEALGQSFSPESWNAWVVSERADLVPGAKAFIQEVYERGGKIALITNREKSLDAHTWNNLVALGLPLSPENTCLIGRSPLDKAAIDDVKIINDKDLRRQQVQAGQANCLQLTGDDKGSWQQPHTIWLEVGDNIEDFTGVTQEHADIDALLPKLGTTLFLLPNPMYGSW